MRGLQERAAVFLSPLTAVVVARTSAARALLGADPGPVGPFVRDKIILWADPTVVKKRRKLPLRPSGPRLTPCPPPAPLRPEPLSTWPCGAPMSILAGLHLYPKTPKDLTVTTRLGGTVSLIGLIVMGFLFATELRAYVVPSLETTIELDDNAEKKLLISFNISLPHVPCHVASVDVKDVLGTRIANVTQNVFKRPSVLQKCPGSTDHAQRPARS